MISNLINSEADRAILKAYVDGLVCEHDYVSEKRNLETELEMLVVPGVDAAEEAGRLVEHLPDLWN